MESALCGGITGLGNGVYLSGELFLRIFTDDPEAIRFALLRMAVIGPTYFICGPQEITRASLRGLNRSVSTTVLAIFGILGVRLVWIDSHANCSERCAPFQGRLYSLTGESGKEDGIPYVPLEEATDIYETTRSGRVWKNGCVSGFNCRHKLVDYKKGFRPIKIPQEVIDRERNIDSQLRKYERTIRMYETRALGWKANDRLDLYRRYRAKAKEWTDRYIAFARENKVAFYPSRLDI